MSGPLDWITPDELTLGHGSGTSTLDGKMDARGEDSWPSTYDGESESTYAALTWDLPTWEGREGGMDRETQRNMALLIDQMVEREVEAEGDDGGPTPTLANGTELPPMWLPFALVGAGLLIVLGFVIFSRRRDQW